MSTVDQAIRAFYADLYTGNPEIKPSAAAQELVDACPSMPDGELIEEHLKLAGAYREFLGFKAPLRKKANEQVDRALVSGSLDAPTISLWLQSPLPGAVDPDRAPRIGDCTLLMLGEAISQMRRQTATLGAQVSRLGRLIGQLADAIDRTGEPDLTVGDAFARGMLDADTLAA